MLWQMTPRIIAFSGKIGAGKDTAADMVVDYLQSRNRSVVKMLFAEPIKKMAAALLGVPEEQFRSQEYKETPIPYLENLVTPRDILICLGENLKQLCGENFFALLMEHRIFQLPPETYIVISDLRFPTELAVVQEMNGIGVRIKRNQDQGFLMSMDRTETSLDDVTFDYEIDNNGTIDELFQQVKTLCL